MGVFFDHNTGTIGWSSGGTTTEPTINGYLFQDYEKTGTYVYVGYENPDARWYIYRRTLSDNTRLYASGSSNYSTNWTNRESLGYA